MRPDVAAAFDRMANAARREARLTLLITSGYRSDAEQAALFAAHPDPKWVAPPGTSLHRYGTELDLGPPAAYGWLAANCRRFGFVKRYEWEPWHYELGLSPQCAASVRATRRRSPTGSRGAAGDASAKPASRAEATAPGRPAASGPCFEPFGKSGIS